MARKVIGALVGFLALALPAWCAAQATTPPRPAYVCPSQVAGQVTVFSSPVQVCGGVITQGNSYATNVLVINGDGQPVIPAAAFADASSLSVLNSAGGTQVYGGFSLSAAFTGTDSTTQVNFGAIQTATNYAGTATAGSGSNITDIISQPQFDGTGTLDDIDAIVGSASIYSGTVTVVDEVSGVGEWGDGGNIGTIFDHYSQFLNDGSGGTLGTAYAYYDDADSGASPTHPYGFYQPATNHPNLFASTVELAYAGASLPVCTDTNKILQTSGCPSSGGTVTSISVVAPLNATTITTTGTVGFPTETAHTVLSGPTTGSAATPTFRALVAADLPAGTTPTGASPTGTVGLSTVNGSATTFMRSDAAPPLSVGIVPTWTGLHTFADGVSVTGPNGVIGVSFVDSTNTASRAFRDSTTSTLGSSLYYSFLSNPTLSGTSLTNVYSFFATPVMSGTATTVSGAVVTPSVTGTSTNEYGFYSSLLAGAASTITTAVGFNALNNFTSGAAVSSYTAFMDNPDLGSSATTERGLYQTATNHPNTLNSILTLTPAAVAAPAAITEQFAPSVAAGTSNTAGANTTINASQSTGTGAGGSLIFQASKAGSTGSAQNAEVTRLNLGTNFNSLCGNDFSGGSFSCLDFLHGENSSSTYAWVIGWSTTAGAPGNAYFQFLSAGELTDGYYGLASTVSTNGTTTPDVYLTRSAAAVLHLGAADAAAPVAQTLGVQGVVAGTSNTAGTLTTLAGSVSTGTGVGGALALATTPAAASSGTTQNAEVVSLKLDGNEHLSAPGGTPGVTSCGTGSPSVSGSDIAGTITVGTTATSCTLTFKIAYAAAPHCTITDQSVLADVTSYTIGTTTIVLTMTSNTGDKVNYVCIGA